MCVRTTMVLVLFLLIWHFIFFTFLHVCLLTYDGNLSVKNWNVDSPSNAIMRDCVCKHAYVSSSILVEICWHTNLLLGYHTDSTQYHLRCEHKTRKQFVPNFVLYAIQNLKNDIQRKIVAFTCNSIKSLSLILCVCVFPITQH